MADESVTENTEIEKPRSHGRPTKHATPHLTEDNELKVTVEGLSALKRNYIIRFKSYLLRCTHRLLLRESKYYPQMKPRTYHCSMKVLSVI